jgi:hypothetical protein
MNHARVYNQLIISAIDRNYDSKLHELHHIIPRCMGGGDVLDNLVALTFREHFIAHLLLAQIHEEVFGLQLAVRIMSNKRKYSSSKYTQSKQKFIDQLSISLKNSHARSRGFIDYDHACDVIWETKVLDQLTSGQTADLLDFPVAYIQRCLLYWASRNDLYDIFEQSKSHVKSIIFSSRRSKFTDEQESRRISKMKATKNTIQFKQRFSDKRKFGNNPSAKQISIDEIVYDSCTRASVDLGCHVNTIRAKVKSTHHPNYKQV